jgi:hypothetical protein
VRVDGPARRNLDVFVVTAVDANGATLATTEPLVGNLQGGAIALPAGTAKLIVNTGKRIVGDVNGKPGGGK